MKTPASELPFLCPNPPVFRALDRLQKTPLGDPRNRLDIGCFKIAFHDTVLLIENGSITQLNADLEPDALRVVIGERRLVLDMWPRSATTVTLAATPAELSAAQTYFEKHGIEVCYE